MRSIISHLPHIGKRKMKSVLAVFIGFCVWQLIRLFVPGLEVHPIYIYIYGIIEMRDSSEKTVNFGKLRIKATFTALCVGLPFLLLSVYLQSFLRSVQTIIGVFVAWLINVKLFPYSGTESIS